MVPNCIIKKFLSNIVRKWQRKKNLQQPLQNSPPHVSGCTYYIIDRQDHMVHKMDLTCKGQLISKCLFGVFNFAQKTNKNKSTWGISCKVESFCWFLGELRICKRTFDFNWPLVVAFTYNYLMNILEIWNCNCSLIKDLAA